MSLMCTKRRYTSKKRQLLTLLLVSLTYFCYLNLIPVPTQHSVQHGINLKGSKKFSPALSATRLNKLFDVLHSKEIILGDLLNRLKILKFQDLLDENTKQELVSKLLISDQNHLKVTEEFVQKLQNVSTRISFGTDHLAAQNLSNDLKSNPVVMTAANNRFFVPLMRVIKEIRAHFRDNRIIVYDLGIKQHNVDKLKKVCNELSKCEIRQFDVDRIYSRIAPHVLDMYTYSWKPIIIQEVLADYESLIYMDSSGHLTSQITDQSLKLTQEIGLRARYLDLNFTCLTDKRMLEWFGNPQEFNNMGTIEANFLVIYRNNLVTSLVMKAWVTCALDVMCIAPPGSSRLGPWQLHRFNYEPCQEGCRCHRFDQAALGAILSFFYAHPVDHEYLPAFAIADNENWFYILRHSFSTWDDVVKFLGLD